MQSWLSSYSSEDRVKGIADGNGEISQAFNMISDNSKYFMGLRCKRFAMIVHNNSIIKIFTEEPGNFDNTSAENILKYI